MKSFTDAELCAQIKERAGVCEGICPRCGAALPAVNRPVSAYAEAQICVDCNVEEIIGSNVLPLNKWWIVRAPGAAQNRLF